MKRDEGSCRQYRQELCKQRYEYHIQAKGQDSIAYFTSEVRNFGKAGIKVMVCKITVAFECKNLVNHNVATMAKMLLVLKSVSGLVESSKH